MNSGILRILGTVTTWARPRGDTEGPWVHVSGTHVTGASRPPADTGSR